MALIAMGFLVGINALIDALNRFLLSLSGIVRRIGRAIVQIVAIVVFTKLLPRSRAAAASVLVFV